MAMQLLNVPERPPRPGRMSSPVTLEVLRELYEETLKTFFDLDEMYKHLAAILGAQPKENLPFSKEQLKPSLKDSKSVKNKRPEKGKSRTWNSKSHGKKLYEPPNKKENGFVWHQAHNTALFLLLAAAMKRNLENGEELDVDRFHKDLRALTARLDIANKAKNVEKRKQSRGPYKKKNLNAVVQEEVQRLFRTKATKRLSSSKRGTQKAKNPSRGKPRASTKKSRRAKK